MTEEDPVQTPSHQGDSSGPALVPLGAVRSGQEVRLVSVVAGHDLRARLAGMGLVPGMVLTVVRNTGGGPLVISARNTRLALGRGMVHRMLVAPVDSPPPAPGGRP